MVREGANQNKQQFPVAVVQENQNFVGRIVVSIAYLHSNNTKDSSTAVAAALIARKQKLSGKKVIATAINMYLPYTAVCMYSVLSLL